MKTTVLTPLAFLALAGLNGCFHESDPSVSRSSLRIDVTKRGDLQLPIGLLRKTTYIGKPALCACDPNTEGKLFVLDGDGRSAKQVKVHYGQSAGSLIEVRDGLKPGDKVIISDMTAYDGYCSASRANVCRIDLR